MEYNLTVGIINIDLVLKLGFVLYGIGQLMLCRFANLYIIKYNN